MVLLKIVLFCFTVIYCDLPQKPSNGFIYQPCDIKYNSQCELGCEDGFFLSGKSKIICGPLKLWEPSNITCESKWNSDLIATVGQAMVKIMVKTL